MEDEQSSNEPIKPGERTEVLLMEEDLIKIERSSHQSEPDLSNILTQDIIIGVEDYTSLPIVLDLGTPEVKEKLESSINVI